MQKSQILIWLDDVRDPSESRWHQFFPIENAQTVWTKSFDEFTSWIKHHGLPAAVCFDHDLGDEVPTGMDAARWLVEYCLQKDVAVPAWSCQSSNPVGKANIESLMRSFARYRADG